MCDDQFTVLAQHYHVIRHDVPGCGQSGIPAVPYSNHEALHELLRDLVQRYLHSLRPWCA